MTFEKKYVITKIIIITHVSNIINNKTHLYFTLSWFGELHMSVFAVDRSSTFLFFFTKRLHHYEQSKTTFVRDEKKSVLYVRMFISLWYMVE